MHLKIEARHLKLAVSKVLHVIEKHKSFEILGCVRMRWDGDEKRIRIEATDLDVVVSVRVDPIDASDDFDVVINAKELSSALAGAGPETITVTREQGAIITKRDKNISMSFVLIDADDYSFRLRASREPMDWPVNDVEAKPFVAFTNARLQDRLSKVQKSISTEEIRYYLNGVFWNNEGFAATDGHRLYVAAHGEDLPAFGFIIPRKTVQLILKLAGSYDVTVERFEDSHLVFHFGPFRITSKLIDGKYPDYRRVIPKPDTIKPFFTADAARFSESFSKVWSFVKAQGMKSVAFNAVDGKLVLDAKCNDSETTVKTGIDISGPERFGVNGGYFLDAIPKHGSFTLYGTDAGSPLLIRQEDEDGLIRIIMPMRV